MYLYSVMLQQPTGIVSAINNIFFGGMPKKSWSLVVKFLTSCAPMEATEDGDVFKVTLDHENNKVKELKMKYFDTIPVSASLCVLKSGFLFAASEFGNHALYQFQAIGDEADVEASSATIMEIEEGFQPVFF